MGKGKICWIRVMKNICYCLAPIVLGVFIFTILSLICPVEQIAEVGNSFWDIVSLMMYNVRQYSVLILTLVIVLLIIMVTISILGVGRTVTKEGIQLKMYDKIFIEVVIFASLVLIFFDVIVVKEVISYIRKPVFGILVLLACGLMLYLVCISLFETSVKRIKTNTLIKTTIIYWMYKKAELILENMKLSIKIGILFVGFIFTNGISFIVMEKKPLIGFIMLIIFYGVSFFYIFRKVLECQKINNAIEQIYKGNTEFKLNEESFKGNFRKVASQVNDISAGLSTAVDERMKSERLKTELITNVSHDIKTPLTSIINYVDLLKKEGITSEKATEYLDILDNKSQRLKKLTEDLVEASKASSGNIKMNMEKLEVNELIKQVSVEFEEKFKKRGLEEIITYTKELVYIQADSRYMYRVLENMYSNVSKYAMENSRVYTDIVEKKSSVIIQIKNISKDKLNIKADELMQRFVRGDVSRNTEGSGLGLSIANSLTELQNGEFAICIDGDLFKVTIEFEKV